MFIFVLNSFNIRYTIYVVKSMIHTVASMIYYRTSHNLNWNLVPWRINVCIHNRLYTLIPMWNISNTITDLFAQNDNIYSALREYNRRPMYNRNICYDNIRSVVMQYIYYYINLYTEKHIRNEMFYRKSDESLCKQSTSILLLCTNRI